MREVRTAALLLRSVPYGESDLITTFLTASDGKVSAIVRGGRKSSRRVGGALEPFHTIDLTLADKGEKSDLMTLREARIGRVRAGITGTLEAVDAGGRALRWLRDLCPPRVAEPLAWASALDLLDALDAGAVASAGDARERLAAFALELLADVGYALELERCVSCGKECPPGRAADVDPFRGGIVCQECGGAKTRVPGELRALAAEAQRGRRPRLAAEQARELLALAEAAMAAHAGVGPS